MARTTVKAELIATNAISGTIIADGAITSTHLAANCVDTSELVTGSIDTIHIAANQVTSAKIVSDAVLTRHIADDQVTQALIAVNSVGISELAVTDGSNGQVLTTNGSGTLSFSTVSGTTINSNADNRVITGSGTANTLNGESTLTFDGNNCLKIIAAGNTTTGGNVQLGITTDDAAKYTAITANQHDSGTETEGFLLIGGNSAANDSNLVNIGGGFGEANPATALRFYTGSAATREGTLRATIDSSGRFGIGTASPDVTLHVANAGDAYFKVQNTSASKNFQIITGGSGARVRSDDALIFDTGSSPAERMRIDGSGRVGQGATSPGFNYDMIYSHATLGAMRLQNQGSFGTYNTLLQVDTFNSASANFQYLVCHSGNGSAINDIEFNLRGDANAYADGSWNGGGADYAEYFEWEDGNSSNEDRIGHSVSLVGNKIKIAESGETVIGVISGNPAVVGDTGWNKWHDKYQKDDYGRYLRDESGHKLVNTDYNDTQEYVTRESRKEWDIVGLMGKLRIKKGQQTGTNWIKMRDISASVEEWLIR